MKIGSNKLKFEVLLIKVFQNGQSFSTWSKSGEILPNLSHWTLVTVVYVSALALVANGSAPRTRARRPTLPPSPSPRQRSTSTTTTWTTKSTRFFKAFL